MNLEEANQLLSTLFDNKFNESNFKNFINELLGLNSSTEMSFKKNIYGDYVNSVCSLGSKKDDITNKNLEVYIVNIKKQNSVEKARVMQRNFITYLLDRNAKKDAALVAFYNEDEENWRLSYIDVKYELKMKKHGIFPEPVPTSAKRSSYLVGEQNHTCKSRFLDFLTKKTEINIENLKEAFSVESVTDEFFAEYKSLYDELEKSLENIIKKDEIVKSEFEEKDIKTSDFCKKLLGQIVFIYFLQKKGWLGLDSISNLGNGDKNFFHNLYYKNSEKNYTKNWDNFFNDCLEPLFYKGFSLYDDEYHHEQFGFDVPFLNGGLFSPIINYDWKKTDILLDNKIFEEIIETFDRFNFTVREDDPLEKEVAVDPEMLGKVFEKLLDELERGKKGSFYTPRDVVHYMCKKSLISYLDTNINMPFEDISYLIEDSNKLLERYSITDSTRWIKESIVNNAQQLDNLLQNVKVADPAVGSGAFPVAMMNEIVRARHILQIIMGKTNIDLYELKKETIKNSLYCVDIDYSATDITKLRFWLSLIVDEEKIEALPNLSNNVMCGNSLVDRLNNIKLFNNTKLSFMSSDPSQSTLDNSSAYYKFEEIKQLKSKYFDEKISGFKNEELKKIQNLKWEFLEESYLANGGNSDDIAPYKFVDNKPFFIWELEFSEVFSNENPGFDIVIGNPPYVSNKKIKKGDKLIKKVYEDIYSIKDDLYNYFFLKSYELARNDGIISFITSNTYFTLNSKTNLRVLFQKNKIIELMDISNVFNDPEVEPAIMILKKKNMSEDYYFNFIDAKTSFEKPKIYNVNLGLFTTSPHSVFFVPSEINLKIYEKFLNPCKKILDEYWDKIKTSREISRYASELNGYRNKLKVGDLTILGLVIEGGQGLATANNGKFVGVLENTEEAKTILSNRAEKLFEAISNNGISEMKFSSKDETQEYLDNLNEVEIWSLFDKLKSKYGNNIFGQGNLYRIISKDFVHDVNNLTEDERNNGIIGKKSYVPYDKGDKKGNRWFLKTPYYLDWSHENVEFLKDNSGKSGGGMPVFRNPQFYFREGFCWNNVLNPNSTLIKCRLKSVSVHDVASMSFFPIMDNLTAKYLVCMINSMFLFKYERTFINNTVNLQINDFKQFPIIVPSDEELLLFENIFDKAYLIKNKYYEGLISIKEHDLELNKIQKELDYNVYRLYGFSDEEIKLMNHGRY